MPMIIGRDTALIRCENCHATEESPVRSGLPIATTHEDTPAIGSDLFPDWHITLADILCPQCKPRNKTYHTKAL